MNIRRNAPSEIRHDVQRLYWCGIKPVRSLAEVAELLNITESEVKSSEQTAFAKIRMSLPPASDRLEAARAIEVSHLFAK
jgi:molecular chaperone GrpE (heat shock protein)